jgi:DNA-nicking Smr family endonuclease
MNPDDKQLFEQAMQGVQPINDDGKASEAFVKPKASQRKAISKPVQARGYSDLGLVFHLTAEAPIAIKNTGLAERDFMRLKRGEMKPQGHLDLHGYRVEAARALTFEFITAAWSEGLRVLRIVHGKGLSSSATGPILKNHLAHWLMQENRLLAACSAPTQEGGRGAIYLLLKKNPQLNLSAEN